MLDIFFDPKRLYTLNEYDSPEYNFHGDVLSFNYKKFKKESVFLDKWEWKNFPTPDEQYHIKFNHFGQLHFIQTINEGNLGRLYADPNDYGKPGYELPIDYYEQFYSGGTIFLYDRENRLKEYVTNVNCKGKSIHNFRRQFDYDEQGNLSPLFRDTTYVFDKGKPVIAIKGTEDKKWFSKEIIEYDESGRIRKIMEYGYERGEDENGELITYMEKGIQHLNTRVRRYENISQNETMCISDANFWMDGQHLKRIIVYDEKGFKKSHQYYSFDGSLYETSNYHFTFDDRENWVKAIVDVKMASEKDVRDNFRIFERDIQYE